MAMKSNKFVNWVDGMKLSSRHFVAEYMATQQALISATSIFLDDHHYGLLPHTDGSVGLISCNITIEAPSTVHATLHELIGVTRDGYFIRQIGAESPPIEQSFPVKMTSDDLEKHLYIIASSDPFNFALTGEPDPEELPLRFPNIQPKVDLSLVQIDQQGVDRIAGGIPIGRVILKSGELVHDETYIPPVMSIESHPDLVGFYHQFLKFVQDIDRHALIILHRMNTKDNLTPLALNVQTLCRAVVHFTERELDNLQHFGLKESPVNIVACASRMGRTLRLNTEMMKGSGKEEMLQYFSEWSSLKPGEYDAVLEEIVGLKYQHFDVDANLRRILNFCKVNGKLFKDLSELDFIGKRKESNVFVAEKTDFKAPAESKSKRKWEF